MKCAPLSNPGTWGRGTGYSRLLRRATTRRNITRFLRSGVPLRRPHVPRFFDGGSRDVSDDVHAISAAQQFDLNPTGVVVRGVSILKTKYDTMEVISYRSPYEIDRWLNQVVRDIQRMIRCWEEGYWDYNLDHACSEYGGCAFTSICKSADPEAWLKTYFVKRVWNPLAKKEQSIEEYEAEMAEWTKP